MSKKSINSPSAPTPSGGYSQAVETSQKSRTLYISGQIPMTRAGEVPDTFVGQASVVWDNLIAQLHAANMTIDNLVKVTTYLSDRKYSDENGEVRRQFLKNCAPALTVIITGIYDESWMLEIDAVAED